MAKVALLGAQGQIARGLVEDLPQEWRLELFSRGPHAPHKEAAARGAPLMAYSQLAGSDYDLVINAAGPGDPVVQRANGRAILQITEYFDNLVLDYMRTHPATGYINLSTGAVYGKDYRGATERMLFELNAKDLANANAYVLAKLVAETKHRQSPDLRIADLRIFGYFSRRMDLNAGFFMAQVMKQLTYGPADFVRDFIASEDLAAHIVALYEAGVPNSYFDAVSACPVTKFEILEALGQQFGLRYIVDGGEPVQVERPMSTISAQDGVNQPVLRSRMTSRQVVLHEAGALISGTKCGA